MEYKIEFPKDYKENSLIQFEAEAKGYLYGVLLTVNNIKYTLSFYDIIRLKQDVEEELEDNNYFFESNLIIVNRVKKEVIIKTIDRLVKKNEFKFLSKD